MAVVMMMVMIIKMIVSSNARSGKLSCTEDKVKVSEYTLK